MAQTSVASRYARAFADVVEQDELNAEAVAADLGSLLAMLQQSPDLKKVWENPSIPAPQKRALLDALARQAGISKPVRNLVAVMIDHRRIGLLPEAVEQFRMEMNRRLGFVDAEVTSARPLGDDERRELEARIGQGVGSKVRARYTTDPGILGGAVVRIGSTIYDGSVKGQLQRIRERLSS